MKLLALLQGCSRAHLRAVAVELGLDRAAAPEAAASALADDERLREIVGRLSDAPRTLLVKAVFGDGAISVDRYRVERLAPALSALERLGLLYAFEVSWLREYRVPADLVPALRRALAARHAAGIAAAPRSVRFLAAPLQTAHDAAAVSAYLERSPVRVKADGDVYQRAWPKLLDTLPPVDAVDGEDLLDVRRLELALGFLREGGSVRVRVDDRPGGGGHRELVPAGDLAGALAAGPGELRARLVELGERTLETACAGALAGELAGRTVELAGFGRAVRALVEEAGVALYGWSDDGVLGLFSLSSAWLAGALELGADRRGVPVAARIVPVETDAAEARPAVCQGNFEVVLLRPPAPAERLVLELACERAPGQAHVFRLTKRSVRAGSRRLGGAAGLVGALRELAGELPQNVERSVAEWSAGERPLVLRSALFLDAGDAAAADRLATGPLAGLVAARLGEGLVAVRADEVREVERALAAAGHSLEPGLERVSGAWHEREPGYYESEYQWRPSQQRAERSGGRWISTLELAAIAA